MQLLLIDVGNTNIHLGVAGPAGISAWWRVRTERDRSGDEHGVLFQALLAGAGLSLDRIGGCAVSCVTPPVAPAIRHFARRYLGFEAEFVGESLRPELAVLYQPPQAVGADRLADAVAVLDRYGAPAVVVDFGTATTFDAISRNGEYLGGAIAPGVGISVEALFRTAAHLPRFELARPEQPIGRNTVESMQAGAYYGFVGQVEGIVGRFKSLLGPDTRVVATGGLAELIAPDAPSIAHVEPNLTLEGLRLIWNRAHA